MTPRHEIQLTLRMLAEIQKHTPGNPITYPQLSAMFQVDIRKAKTCVMQLVDAGHKIGSSKRKPMGLFLARHPVEIFETAERMKREALRYFHRHKMLRTWDHDQPTVFEGMDPMVDQAEAEMMDDGTDTLQHAPR